MWNWWINFLDKCSRKLSTWFCELWVLRSRKEFGICRMAAGSYYAAQITWPHWKEIRQSWMLQHLEVAWKLVVCSDLYIGDLGNERSNWHESNKYYAGWRKCPYSRAWSHRCKESGVRRQCEDGKALLTVFRPFAWVIGLCTQQQAGLILVAIASVTVSDLF